MNTTLSEQYYSATILLFYVYGTMVFFKVSLSTIWLIKIDMFLRIDAITNNTCISISKMSQFEPKISFMWCIIYADFVCAT